MFITGTDKQQQTIKKKKKKKKKKRVDPDQLASGKLADTRSYYFQDKTCEGTARQGLDIIETD